MEHHKILDNLSGQEIKEMINRKEATIEELDIRDLDALFDYESELVCAGESDDELLQQIAKLLDSANQIDNVERKYRQLIRDALAPKTIPKTTAKRPRLRKVLIIAATFLVLAIGVSAIAEAMGFGVVAYFRDLMRMPAGSHLETETITLIRLDGSKEYKSIEELLRSENIDILYPHVLPENVSIKSVFISSTENGGENINFYTGSEDTSIVVDINIGTPPNEYIDSEKYRIGDREYYLFEEAGYFAVCYDNNHFYRIRSTSRDNIILIIENMKELGQ